MNFTEGARDQDGTKYKLTSTTAVNVENGFEIDMVVHILNKGL